MIRSTLLAGTIVLSTAATALANDTIAELKTGGLTFTRSLDISMVEEKLYISPREVRVDYVFRNTSDRPIDTIVAFPMPDIGSGPDQNVDTGNIESDNFLGFTVTQDGESIQPQLQQKVSVAGIDMTEVVRAANVPLLPLSQETRDAVTALPEDVLADWLARGLVVPDTYDDGSGMKTTYMPVWKLHSVYYWRTSFPPGQDVRVSHKYRPSVGGTVAIAFLEPDGKPREGTFQQYRTKYCIDDAFVKAARRALSEAEEGASPYFENWISYVLTTGANWMGPIKKFTLTIDKGEPDYLVSFCGTGVKKTGPTTFEMTATDFYPEKDIDILLLVPSQAP